MIRKQQGIIKFTEEKDEKGRTVLRPLTKADRRAMESGLKNKKGLIIGDTLEDSKQCPLELESELPFEISLCGIEVETGEGQRDTRQSARKKWLEGDKEGAMELLGDVLKES